MSIATRKWLQTSTNSLPSSDQLYNLPHSMHLTWSLCLYFRYTQLVYIILRTYNANVMCLHKCKFFCALTFMTYQLADLQINQLMLVIM